MGDINSCNLHRWEHARQGRFSLKSGRRGVRLAGAARVAERAQFGTALLAERSQRFMAWPSTSSRISEKVLFGARYVSRTKWTTASAFSITGELETACIRLTSA
jgi:hypothetical protein